MEEKRKGEIVLANAIRREKGYLYYIDKYGNVCRSRMKNVKLEGEQ